MALTAGAEATEMVAEVRDDPVLRLELAARFYDRRPGNAGIRPYRRAEVAFMRWQISRGVLRPPTADPPGSPWWRAVNESLIRDTCEADRLFHGRPGPPSRPSVRQWLRFLHQPSANTWYCAHNSSIVAGYLEHRDLAQRELPVERFFMDVALLRVLFAHSLVAAPRVALGRLAPIGRMLGDPRRRMADLFLSLRRTLPDRYPLEGISVAEVLEQENRIGRLLDYTVVAPRVQAVYRLAASELDEPRLLGLVRNGAAIYAWPYEERHVWTMAKEPFTVRMTERLTRTTNGQRSDNGSDPIDVVCDTRIHDQ